MVHIHKIFYEIFLSYSKKFEKIIKKIYQREYLVSQIKLQFLYFLIQNLLDQNLLVMESYRGFDPLLILDDKCTISSDAL